MVRFYLLQKYFVNHKFLLYCLVLLAWKKDLACVNVFLFSSFWYISKIEIAGSYGNLRVPWTGDPTSPF